MHKKSGLNTFPFCIEVPYKLIETGKNSARPLIIYLHGYKQNIQYFEKKFEPLLSINANHLFIQGPYPVYDESRSRKVEQWGRAWYLYDGEQKQFINSMEKTSVHIEKLLKSLKKEIKISRVAVIGYSMGGYLAGYFALSRPQLVDDLLVIGGRIKNETFPDKSFNDMRILHLHGMDDRSVSSSSAQKSCEALSIQGAQVTFREVDAAHKLTSVYINETKKWMIALGYNS